MLLEMRWPTLLRLPSLSLVDEVSREAPDPCDLALTDSGIDAGRPVTAAQSNLAASIMWWSGQGRNLIVDVLFKDAQAVVGSQSSP